MIKAKTHTTEWLSVGREIVLTIVHYTCYTRYDVYISYVVAKKPIQTILCVIKLYRPLPAVSARDQMSPLLITSTLCRKNDTDVAHYNFNVHQPILVITNHHLIAYSVSNISAKYYQNQLICVEVIVCNISVVF